MAIPDRLADTLNPDDPLQEGLNEFVLRIQFTSDSEMGFPVQASNESPSFQRVSRSIVENIRILRSILN